MDDLISRQAAIEALEREKTYCTAFRDGYTPINVFEKYNAGLTDGIKALKNLPSAHPAADVVEVVRCKDCVHYNNKRTFYDDDICEILYYCDGVHRTACERDFCSYGRRRVNGQTDH